MEAQYHKLLEDILEYGEETTDRTGVGTKSIFGYQMRFNLAAGFPAVTTKRLAWRSVVGELLWFLEGSTDERRLAELTYGEDRTELVGRNTIWTANADAQGKALGYINTDFRKELGPVYGAQWRNFGGTSKLRGVDQIQWLLDEIRSNPDSRRLILSAWNPNKISSMALPPCHFAFQLSVRNNKLYGMLTMRSNDVFLGTPFNIASYALLIHIFARELKLEVGELVYSIGDAHVYLNHIDQVKEQLSRESYPLPRLKIQDNFNLILNGEFGIDDVNKFHLKNYLHHSAIKGKMAV
jgi:thymidylate synthase